MDASKVFATPIPVDIRGFAGELRPLEFSAISKVGEMLIQEQIQCVPSISDILDCIEVKSGEEFRKFMAEAAYTVADLKKKARVVEIGDILARLDDPIIMPKVLQWNLVRKDGSPATESDVSAVMFFVMKNGIDKPACNISRWFEVSGVTDDLPDPTKSATAS
jgi:hypothetical protein